MCATIAPLPDDALVAVFQQLQQRPLQPFELGARQRFERDRRCIALVCRHWRQLADGPLLCRNLDICLGRPYHQPRHHQLLPRLRSLAEWLIRRASRHMQRLDLTLEGCGLSLPEYMEACSILTGALAACGSHGLLTRLRLKLDLSLHPDPGENHYPLAGLSFSSWAAALASLRRLSICSTTEVAYSGDLRCLNRLEELELAADSGNMHAAVQLPPSVTKLTLWGRDSDGLPGAKHMPPQVAGLSRLQVLELRQACFSGKGCAPLKRLPSLRSLVVDKCTSLPRCLSRLTSLRELVIDERHEETDLSRYEGTLRAALRQLTRLTRLALCHEHDMRVVGMDRPPAELACLPRLRSFLWKGASPQDAALPGGAWLGGLQSLAAPCHLLLNSLAELAGAPRLRQLGAMLDSFDSSAAGLVHWAGRQPSMREVLLDSSEWSPLPALTPEESQAAQAVQGSRPDLRIRLVVCLLDEFAMRP